MFHSIIHWLSERLSDYMDFLAKYDFSDTHII